MYALNGIMQCTIILNFIRIIFLTAHVQKCTSLETDIEKYLQLQNEPPSRDLNRVEIFLIDVFQF